MAAAISCKAKETPGPTPSDTRKLEFAKQEVEVDFKGGAISFELSVNFEYTVDIQGSWLKLDPSKPASSSAIHFIAEENAEASERSATIKVSDAKDRYFAKTATITQKGNPVQKTVLNIVDKNATEQTKALFANLWAIEDKGFMFGHHDDLWYGRYWYNEPGKSDTKSVCGDYPAVFSVDFGPIMDNRHGSSENEIRRRVILEARERGEVILACCHLNNPLTGGDSWDNSNNEVVKGILTPGSDVRKKYTGWLDNLADFANNLKDSKGELIPVILRIYHEHTQSWSWWGSKCTTASEFVEFWQFTVKYLRDTKGVHNFLYAVSPQMDSWYSTDEASNRIVFRWPGDDYVDFMGIDCYHGQNPAALNLYLDALTKWAENKKKPCGVTEDGQEGFTASNFWTTQVVEPFAGRRVSMVVMWRNKYVGSNEGDKHYYSVYPGHPSEDDFRKMYDNSRSFFSKDLPDMYTLPKNYEIK